MLSLGLLFLLAQPAFAAELGEPNITPQTKMEVIRSNPSIV
ncbi:MAG: alpha/beta hydrolase, partial [Faecalibacterium sp.]|nr:alpha/beta hydrolase [Faecalibacterium sp.]